MHGKRPSAGTFVTVAVLKTGIKESLYYVHVVTSLKSSAGLEPV